MSHCWDRGDFRCFACGRVTGEVTEGGPTAEAAGQVHRWKTGVLEVERPFDYGAAVACWPCFWATDPDMWIDDVSWDELHPSVPSHKLPRMFDYDTARERFDPALYPWPLVDNLDNSA